MYFHRTKYILIFCVFLLASCASSEQVLTATPLPVATPLPITPTVESCAFVEATQDLPDVSAQVDSAIKEIQPDSSGRAEAYGENCVYASGGQSTFSAMETDFYFTINVRKLNDNTELGTWVVNAMNIIQALPPSAILGPQAGFIEFTFQTKDDQKSLRIPIDKYKNLPTDINPSDLIPTLFPNP